MNGKGTLTHKQAPFDLKLWSWDVDFGRVSVENDSVLFTEGNLSEVWKRRSRADNQATIDEIPALTVDVLVSTLFDGTMSRPNVTEIFDFHENLDDIVKQRPAEPITFSADFVRLSHARKRRFLKHANTGDDDAQD